MNCQPDSLLPERPGSIWSILQSRHEPVHKMVGHELVKQTFIINLSNKSGRPKNIRIRITVVKYCQEILFPFLLDDMNRVGDTGSAGHRSLLLSFETP